MKEFLIKNKIVSLIAILLGIIFLLFGFMNYLYENNLMVEYFKKDLSGHTSNVRQAKETIAKLMNVNLKYYYMVLGIVFSVVGWSTILGSKCQN